MANYRDLAYHGYSIWLFTRSDLKTIIGPTTAFGIFNGLAASAYGLHSPHAHTSTILKRVPMVTFWVWINLLPHAIDNQLSQKAISEDAYNKPWRTLPSKRMTPKQASALRLPLFTFALLSSWHFGGVRQCIVLACLARWYNHMGGGDINAIVRNFINSVGYICFTSGSFEVILGNIRLPDQSLPWFLVLGMVVFSTVQTQDFSDSIGDSVRGRKTLPLQIGDRRARILTATLMIFWSCFCTWFWGHRGLVGGVPLVVLGCYIAYRLMGKRSIAQDKTTFLFWNMWIVILYILPLVSIASSTS